jgi:hypothetical protein
VCAPLAGKSTLNRLEHAPAGKPSRYHRIGHDGAAIEALFVDLFLDAHRSAPRQIILDLDATDIPLTLLMDACGRDESHHRLHRLLCKPAVIHSRGGRNRGAVLQHERGRTVHR